MFLQTPKKRVLFKRTLTTVVLGVLSMATILYGGFALWTQRAYAATNSTVNFQARLEGAGGNIAADGYYNIQFKLYSASTGGTALWTESYFDSNGVTAGNDNRVQVVNGYVSVALGSQTAFPGTINWDQNLYLTMNIGGTTQTATPTYDGEMSPRLTLGAVPYAFKAGQLAQANSAGTLTSTLSLLQPTVGNQNFQIQDQGAGGTYSLCVQNSAACGFAAATGAAGYIQNQTAAQQASSTYWISGTGRSDTALQAPSFDTPTAVALNIGTTNATSITLGKVGANTIVGGNLSVGTTQSLGAITVANGAWFTSLDSAGTGTINVFSVNSSNQIQLGAALSVDGGIILPTNGGQLTLSDLPIDSTASAGTKQSYTLRVGSSNALTVYGEADGSGNAQNLRVAVGSSITPAYTLDVGGDGNVSGAIRSNTISVITSAQVLQNVTASAGILTSGTVGTSLLSGSYTGITGVGTITAGTWNASTIGVQYGGTGLNTYTVGDILYASGTTTIAKLAAVAAGSCLKSNGTGTAPVYGSCTTGGVTLQGSTPGTPDTGNINISGVIIAGTSLQAPLLDTPTAGALNIGTTNATSINLNRTTAISGSLTVGASAGSGSQLTNNGAFINSTLALGNFSSGGSIGSAATTIDIYSSISVAQTTSSQTLTLPTPTASTVYGRQLYLSNIGTDSFTLLGTPLKPGATASMVWANTSGGASWQYAGADGNGILNQNAVTQTAAFTINGTGTAGTFSSTTFSSASNVTLQAASGNNININPGANGGGSGTLNLAINAATLNIGNGSNNVRAINIGNTAGSQAQTVVIGNNGGSSSTTTLQASNGVLLQTNSASAGVTVKSVTDSATAFQVQNASAAALFTVDTSGSQVLLGKAGASGINGKLVFNNGTNTNTASISSGVTTTSYSLTLPTALGASGDCLKDTNGSGVLGFGTCATSGVTTVGTFSATSIANGASISGSTITFGAADGTNPGMVSTGAQTFAGAKTFSSAITAPTLQNAGTLALAGTGASGAITLATNGTTRLTVDNAGGLTYSGGVFALQNASANRLLFDTTNSILKVYDSGGSGVYASISANSSGATFAASSGTTTIGSGTGDVTSNLTGLNDKFSFSKTYTAAAAYNKHDFSIQRAITGGTNVLSGSVLRIEDLSSATTASNIQSTVLLINQSNTSASGYLLDAQSGGTSRLTVSNSGDLTLYNGGVYASDINVSTIESSGGLSIGTGYASAITIGSSSITTELIGTIQIGNATNNVTFSSSSGEPTLNGTARHTRRISLSAEYAGASMTADGTNNTGSMTSDNMTSSPYRNYYKWANTRGTAQDYDIWVRVPLPSDFAAMPSGQTICIDTYASATTANGVKLNLYGTNNSSVTLGTSDLTPTSAATWQNKCTSSITGGTYAANGYMMLDIKLTAPATTGDIRIGDITFDYLSKW